MSVERRENPRRSVFGDGKWDKNLLKRGNQLTIKLIIRVTLERFFLAETREKWGIKQRNDSDNKEKG